MAWDQCTVEDVLKFYQVNQTSPGEFSNNILIAPRDNRAGHNLLSSLEAGDLIFHYSAKSVHAVSRVLPWSFENARKKVLELGGPGVKVTGRVKGDFVALVYTGRHLTDDNGTTDHSVVLVETVLTKLTQPNFFPGRQIYMKEIGKDAAQAVLAEAGYTDAV